MTRSELRRLVGAESGVEHIAFFPRPSNTCEERHASCLVIGSSVHPLVVGSVSIIEESMFPISKSWYKSIVVTAGAATVIARPLRT